MRAVCAGAMAQETETIVEGLVGSSPTGGTTGGPLKSGPLCICAYGGHMRAVCAGAMAQETETIVEGL